MRFVKTLVVLVVSVFLTTLALDATSTFENSKSLVSMAGETVFGTETCPEGMVEILGSTLCVDAYEVGVGENCPLTEPKSLADTALNLQKPACKPVSKEGVLPWRYVTHEQAKQLCAIVKKRLPTAKEWYEASLGTRDGEACNNSSNRVSKTGMYKECYSGSGTYDMIGNVWEYVSDTAQDGMYDGRALPIEGYVAAVDGAGVVTITQATATVAFASDYAWTVPNGAVVLLRGGFYSSGSDGGIYTLQAKAEPSFAGAAVGFRCVTDRSGS